MSLSTALNSAISGLQVASRGTQVVADNIANSGTDGYGVRSVTQASRTLGGTGSGVVMTGIDRRTDPVLLGATRAAKAEQSAAVMISAFWTQAEQSIGTAGTSGALGNLVLELDDAFTTAIAAPESRAGLARVAQAAGDITTALRKAQDVVLNARDQADAGIARDIQTVNTLLTDVAQLNKDIQTQTVRGASPNGLMDQRQLLIDQIALIIPVTEIQRDFGRVMLLAADGTVLVDREAAQFSFDRRPNPQPGETVANGGLSAITLGLRTLETGHAIFGQGRLTAALTIRDDLVPMAQTELDRVSADLITRFSGPPADPTLPAGAFGLFDDPGQLPPLTTLGISGRIAVSSFVQPDDPSTLWRLRDGLGATLAGPVGRADILDSMRDALRAVTRAGTIGEPDRDAHGHSTDLASVFSTNRLRANASEAQTATRAVALEGQLLAQSVDTDAEMQKLLVLEQSYAANAKVIQALDQMMQTLLEI